MTLRKWSGPVGKPRRCPHADDVQFCPLYVASHSPHGNGCENGHADEGRCAIDYGRDYLKACAKMQRTEPALFTEVLRARLGSKAWH